MNGADAQTLNELRAAGWMVAVHNDYRKGKKLFTFWLMTRSDGRFLKGEGETDGIALEQIADQLRAMNDRAFYLAERCFVKSQDSTGRLRWCGRHNSPIGGRNVCEVIDPSQFGPVRRRGATTAKE